MTEEEKKAIEYFKEERKYLYKYSTEHDKNTDIILNLINKQQKEIEKKGKIIDKMVCIIYANLGKLGVCDCELEDGRINIELCNQTLADKNCIDCIKQYFENKVEGE